MLRENHPPAFLRWMLDRRGNDGARFAARPRRGGRGSGRPESLSPKKDALSRPGEECDLPVHGGGANSARNLRLQAPAHGIQRETIPESYTKGKRFAFMDSSHRTDVLGQNRLQAAWRVRRLGQRLSAAHRRNRRPDCDPEDVQNDLFNHAPAKLFMNCGSGLFGRPSMGAWITYGLGSECDKPAGIRRSPEWARGPRGGAALWGSGSLPTTYQGVPLRNQGDPIVNLSLPPVFRPTSSATRECRPRSEHETAGRNRRRGNRDPHQRL